MTNALPSPKTRRVRPPARSGSAFLIVLVALSAVFSLLSLVQFHLGRRRTELRMERARVELGGAVLLGVERGLRLWEENEAAEEQFQADNGALVRLRLADMQAFFDVNSLLRSEALQEPFLRILRAFGHDPDRQEIDTWILAGQPLADLREWPRILPGAADWLGPNPAGSPDAFLTALPPPPAGLNRVNLNTVSGELLRLLAGPEAAPWVDTVLTQRAEEPLQSVDSVLSLLPPPLAAALGEVFTVDSRWMMLLVEAEYDYTLRRGSFLLTRTHEGWIEVFSCR